MTILIYICDRDQLIVLANQYNSDAVIYVMIKEVNEDEFSFVLCECCRENVDQINFRSVWFHVLLRVTPIGSCAGLGLDLSKSWSCLGLDTPLIAVITWFWFSRS